MGFGVSGSTSKGNKKAKTSDFYDSQAEISSPSLFRSGITGSGACSLRIFPHLLPSREEQDPGVAGHLVL